MGYKNKINLYSFRRLKTFMNINSFFQCIKILLQAWLILLQALAVYLTGFHLISTHMNKELGITQ